MEQVLNKIRLNLQFNSTDFAIPKIEPKLEVTSGVDGKPAKLYLYGTIRKAYPWEDESACISAQRVMNALAGLKGQNIDLHINSGGGDVFESIAICNLLKQHDGEVNAYIDSLAGSGGSVIPMAAKNVYMWSNCMMMLHNASAAIYGNAKDLRKAADDLDKISAAAMESYKNKFVGTEEELKQLLGDESWLTAKECLAFGFCTEILPDKKEEETPPDPQVSTKQTLFAKYCTETPPDHGSIKETLFNKFKKE